MPANRSPDLRLAVWPCVQTTSQWQRHGRYLAESNAHPAKMLPELARRAIEAYSDPGDLVVDPMCGIGTTLVEAIHLDRRAIGVELEERWRQLAAANIAFAQQQGAPGRALAVRGDARDLSRLLTKHGRDLLSTSGKAARSVVRLPYGRVDLVVSSPPYAAEVGRFNQQAWGSGRSLCQEDTRNYSPDRANLGHARGTGYLAAMADVYRACAAALKPGGFLVLVTKNMRADGHLRDLAADTIALCQQTDLIYWQHVIALLATVRDGELFPRPSVWQRIHLRRALARRQRAHLVCHEDVLVFRKPDKMASGARAATADLRTAA